MQATDQARRAKGFTLIELMVVLILVAIVGAMVVGSIGSRDRERTHLQYLSRIQAFVDNAYIQARLNSQDHALQWYRDQAVLLVLTQGFDEQDNPVLLAEEKDRIIWPDSLEVALQLDGMGLLLPSALSAPPPAANTAQIYILPDGSSESPWALDVLWQDDGELFRRLVADGLNRPQWRYNHE